MQQPPYAMTPPPPKSKMPTWGWVLLGCSGTGCLVVPILAAIIFPVFAQAREKAREVSCLANQKQIANALTMYAQDNDGHLPPASKWMDATEPYVKNKSVYHCPSAVNGGPDAPSYAFDDSESGNNVKKMSQPERHYVIWESRTHTRNAHDRGKSRVYPGRHRNGNHYVFADGHAEWLPDSEFAAPNP